MFPQIDLNIVQKENEDYRQKDVQGITYLYDFRKGDFVLKDGKLVKVNGKDGVKIWIEKILITEEFKFKIYKGDEGNEEYGTTIRKLILGRKIPQLFLCSELKRIISEKLTQHAEIEKIDNFAISQEMATLTIGFTVILKNGDEFGQEVSF